jgi:hypothetical protein
MCRRPIAEELVEALDEVRVKWPGRKVSVVVVGHALGGALAVLNSMVLAASPMVDSVITYTEGCPSILTDDAVRHLQGLRQEAVISTGTARAGAELYYRPLSRVIMLNVAHCQVCASTS